MGVTPLPGRASSASLAAAFLILTPISHDESQRGAFARKHKAQRGSSKACACVRCFFPPAYIHSWHSGASNALEVCFPLSQKSKARARVPRARSRRLLRARAVSRRRRRRRRVRRLSRGHRGHVSLSLRLCESHFLRTFPDLAIWSRWSSESGKDTSREYVHSLDRHRRPTHPLRNVPVD